MSPTGAWAGCLESFKDETQEGEIHVEARWLLESRRWSWKFGENQEARVHRMEFQWGENDFEREPLRVSLGIQPCIDQHMHVSKLPKKRAIQKDKGIVPDIHSGSGIVPVSIIQTGTTLVVGDNWP